MDCTNLWLPEAIHRLSTIADEGNLSDLMFAFSAECRLRGGLPHPAERAQQVQHLNAGDVAKARDIARVASNLFGISRDRAEQIAREVLVRDPWTDIALDLIDDYSSNMTTAEKAMAAKPKRQPARRRVV
jgi:hypothetical protein